MRAPDDRWWRGLDAIIVDALAPGSRVIDVGCGDGGLVERLVGRGLVAVGVDPRAPARARLITRRVEELGAVEPFDAACAVMSLHHADLQNVPPAIARLLGARGRLFVNELAWETYDERAAAWLDANDRSDSDNSVAGWRLEHADLHTGAAVRAALCEVFDIDGESRRPYLARMLGVSELEAAEQRLIDAGALPAIACTWVATVRSRHTAG